jgi:O-6-methylguanine DNA methyltransferase
LLVDDAMKKVPLSYEIFDSPMGSIYLVFAGKMLSGLSFIKPVDISLKKGTAPKSLINDLQSYFNGSVIEFEQEVSFLSGTDFEKHVWTALRQIPCGETRTYKWVAEAIGNPSAVRAVGRALSKNPLPIVIPCHRVIESDGSLGGYSLGTDIKRRLLEMEYYAQLNSNLSSKGE